MPWTWDSARMPGETLFPASFWTEYTVGCPADRVRVMTPVGWLIDIYHGVLRFSDGHPIVVAWLSAASLVTFLGTLVLIPVMVARMPADYFLYDRSEIARYRKMHPAWSLLTVVVKNLLGVVFIACGIAMLVLPGQGVLTILVGITLVSFPKKRSLELMLIRRKSVRSAVDWVRAKAGREPIVLPGNDRGRS